MRRGQIPEFPIFVDGMVRSVNAVYASFADDLSPPVRRKVERGEEVFYSEWVSAISTLSDRNRVISGPPCCIVASSGMLIGGASSYYAEKMAGDASNLIAITGYQDEESPGRALLDLVQEKTPEERALTLNGQRVKVACRVETYSLSAHADAGELTGLVQRLKPRSCYLVHGDESARKALSVGLDAHLPEGVHLPENGGTYTMDSLPTGRGKSYGRRIPRAGIAGGRALSNDTLMDVRAYVVETGAKGPFRVQELAEIWFGTEMTTPSESEAFRLLLTASKQQQFEPDYRRPFLYHVKTDVPFVDGPMEMNEARVCILAAFPIEAGLFKCSAHVDQRVYELAFHFPDVIKTQYGDVLRQLETETGWILRLRETPHQGRLFEEAKACVPEGATALKAPALRLDQHEVSVTVAVSKAIAGNWEHLAKAASENFKMRTGFDLVWDRPDVKTEAPALPKQHDAWEINRAYGEIRKAFQGNFHAPSKVGLKGGAYIEVAFISPMIGKRYRELLDQLSEQTGWDIRIRPSNNQDQISQVAQALTPEKCVMRGAPRIYPDRVVVPVMHVPDESERDALAIQFEDQTGFAIVWESPKG